MGQRRVPTQTSRFGVSRRESHDASAFYARFTPPELSADATLALERAIDAVYAGDARSMPEIQTASVALVVTSPPYFAGKEYEEALGEGHIPSTYLDYLQMLEDVFAECVRTLEPGGRIAVNVANLGRRPYRSLSSDVITILQDRLRLLLRGEVIWRKARGSTGSCAWGSFQRPANPVLRDLTERVVIASKGRFDRALPARRRERYGFPSAASLSCDEFMESTTDVWEIAPESATRVGHAAPFPIALPERLIHLYTYYDDLVLDPFIGSGTTAVAAVRSGRHFAGYDLDPAYVALANQRIEDARLGRSDEDPEGPVRSVVLPASRNIANDPGEGLKALKEGVAARRFARDLIERSGFTAIEEKVRLPGGVEVSFRAYDQANRPWLFDLAGGFTSTAPGLRRTETLWRVLGKAAVLHEVAPDSPLVVLTTGAPTPGGPGQAALSAVLGEGKPIAEVVVITDAGDHAPPQTSSGHPVLDPMTAVPAAGSAPGWPGRVAVGVLRGEPPQVFLAANDAVLGRLLALRVVAATDPGDLGVDATREIREALVEERWADAVATWMTATGEVVDGYPDEPVVTEAMLDGDRVSMEIRLAPIFRDPAPQPARAAPAEGVGT